MAPSRTLLSFWSLWLRKGTVFKIIDKQKRMSPGRHTKYIFCMYVTAKGPRFVRYLCSSNNLLHEHKMLLRGV